MTDLDVNRDQMPSSSEQPPQHEPSSRWKGAALAGFLSLIIAGLGQLYNRQPRKALWLVLPIPILIVLVAQTRIVFSFFTMVAFFTILLAWRLFVVAEAAHNAWSTKKPETKLPYPRLTYSVVAAMLLAAALYPSYDEFKSWTSFAVFKVPSRSMCPTICSGERIVADMAAYRSKSPVRGDIVLLKHESSPALFIKRVIGISGDVVAPGPNGTILVNGKPLIPSEVCGIPIRESGNPADYSMFESTKVHEGEFFVVGDNLGDSYDSRIPEFGPVLSGMIRGKPLFLYWSPSQSRIACPTR